MYVSSRVYISNTCNTSKPSNLNNQGLKFKQNIQILTFRVSNPSNQNKTFKMIETNINTKYRFNVIGLLKML